MNPTDKPVAKLFDGVIGQERAVQFLRTSAAAPVHAYLFVGPDSTGARAAARGFAAAVLCPNGGCGDCSTCVRALADRHPDLLVVERDGAAILVKEAREVIRLAMRSPMEGGRKVLVLTDFHSVDQVAPMLLKTIEEPPPSAVFCILADQITPDLVTIASRCVQVEFPPLSIEVVASTLVSDGVAADIAAESAALSAGLLARARLLAADDEKRARIAMWRTVPDQLDGTAGQVVAITGMLVGLLEAVAAPIVTQHKLDDAEMAERAKQGIPGIARNEVEARQKRIVRRARTDELRAGLAALAGVYRDRIATEQVRSARRALVSLDAIADTVDRLQYNPAETTLLEGLLARLSV